MGLASRTVRVFVSSTFRDMQEEREQLVKHVFPALRRICAQRGVTFVDVDLRWGVTSEQAADGRVLPICLDEIDRCRPFFIGLIGQRYGWVPENIPAELVQRRPWLAEHRSKSVTELEIIHGVLRNPTMANRAVFYFRDPAYIERIPADRRDEFQEPSPKLQEKLESLKATIRGSGVAYCKKCYPDPVTLGQWVLEDLTTAINQLYPDDGSLDPLERESIEHEAFALSRCDTYVEDREHLHHLNQHAASQGDPLVVLGDPGSGKSALLANWLVQFRQEYPDVPAIATLCWK